MINEIIEKARELYGVRKNDAGNCTFCKSYVGNGFCNCIESFQINRIAQRINKKTEFIAHCKEIGVDYIDLIKNNNVPLKYANATLNIYQTRNQLEIDVKNKVGCYQTNIIENYLTGKNLLLIGNYGTAKSLLLSALCNYCSINKGLTGKYVNITDLADEVRSTFSDGTPKTTEDVINSYLRLDYLFVDDLDKEKPTEFVKNLIYKIINKRYDEKKPTCISSNTDIMELDLDYFGEATVSRMVENCVVIYFKSENERYKSEDKEREDDE